MFAHREEAAAYIYNPAQHDTRRGLKRSWRPDTAEDGSPRPGSSGGAFSTKDTGKGKFFLVAVGERGKIDTTQ